MPGEKSSLLHCLIERLPCNCLLCGRLHVGQFDLCQACVRELPYIERACDRCGLPLPGDSRICGTCVSKPPAMTHSVSLFHYRMPVDRLIAGLKFDERFDYGRCLARLLSQFIQQHYSDRELPQILVPVPLHWRRARQRGFNQSAVLAITVARALGIPLLPELLWRQRRTAAQTSLYSAAARRRNVANAFACRSTLLEDGIGHVALLDDVVTTAATLNAAALCLRRAGIARVDAWSIARASR
jgi:ComF family protein